MADTKISDLTAGGAAQAADAIPVARAGGNVKVTAADIAAAATAVGTLGSLAVTGAVTLGGDVGLSRGAADRLDVATGDSVNVVSGDYQIGGTSVLNGTTLGAGVTGSSLTSVGTLGSLTVDDPSSMRPTLVALSQVWNYPAIAVTGASGTGTIATLTFAAQPTAIPVGSRIAVSSMNPSGYNTATAANNGAVVTASTTTSVSYANATTASYVSGGSLVVIPRAVQLFVTNTTDASAAGLVLDVRSSPTSTASILRLLTNGEFTATTVRAGFPIGAEAESGGVKVTSTSSFSWASTTTISSGRDLELRRDAADILAQRRTTNAQTFRWYRTFTDASNYERGALQTAAGQVILAAETAGTGTDDIDVTLTPAGTGLVRYGTHSAIGAETVTGYIEVKDAGGTIRKLAVVS
jgi:hypothetical protein